MGFFIYFLQLSYKIENLEKDKKYIVNMNVSACLEPDDCYLKLPVIDNLYLSKSFHGCDWANLISSKFLFYS